MLNELEYYSTAGKLTNLAGYMETIDELTDNPEFICQIVQGLMIHGGWIKVYNIEQKHRSLSNSLYMSDLLGEIINADQRSLTIPRLPENRVIGDCCRFSTLSCAILRAKGIPARSRCGFSVYLGWKGSLEDHWIVEYWNGERWVMNDPQIDPFQLSKLNTWGYNQLSIQAELHVPNPHDLTDQDFITAGKAWQMCREGTISPKICGIDDLHGLWFVRGQLLRDFAALNKIEIVPYLSGIEMSFDWSIWELMSKSDDELSKNEFELLDTIAALTLNINKNLSAGV